MFKEWSNIIAGNLLLIDKERVNQDMIWEKRVLVSHKTSNIKEV